MNKTVLSKHLVFFSPALSHINLMTPTMGH